MGDSIAPSLLLLTMLVLRLDSTGPNDVACHIRSRAARHDTRQYADYAGLTSVGLAWSCLDLLGLAWLSALPLWLMHPDVSMSCHALAIS